MPASSPAATTTATEPLTSSPSVGDTIETYGVVVPLPFEPEPEPEPEPDPDPPGTTPKNFAARIVEHTL